MSGRHESLIALLAAGKSVQWCEGGNSMQPLISHREEMTLSPIDTEKLEVGDIVLARVKGRYWIHRVSAIAGARVQIANNKGHVNGWTKRDKVYGIVTAVSGQPLRSAQKKIRT